MAYLRHAARHIETSIENRVMAILSLGGWLTEGSVPFGTEPVKFRRRRIAETEFAEITGNLVAVTFGNESDVDDLELGGGLQAVDHLVWVDVVAQKDAVGVAIASDIKDGLSGRNSNFSRFIPIRDYTVSEEGIIRPDYQGEFTEVIRRAPSPVEWRKFWQIVNATCTVRTVGEMN